MTTTMSLIRITALLVLAALPAAAADSTGPACTPIPGSAGLLGAGKVLLLGELHGTRESPAFAASVVCNALAADLDVVLGLELSGDAQSAVNAYLASAGTEDDRHRLVGHPLWQRSYQDGRTSRAMVKLIDRMRRLRQANNAVKIVMFDASGGAGGQRRERDMAANLLRSIEGAPEAMHVVLTGNRHSRVFRGGHRDSEYEPMGHVLTQALGADRVMALDAAYVGGTAWVCSPNCGILELGGGHGGPSGSIEVDEETRPPGHHGWYFVGTISASPPASGESCRAELKLQEATLSSDYNAFDQTMGQGWRALAKAQCQPEAAQLIEQYLTRHAALAAGQRRILHFHAGQMLAFDDENAAAIAHFEQAINEGEAEDASFKWNAYVRATLAFLRGDVDELARQREVVAQSAPRGGRVPNLHVVDALLAHAGQSYRMAYAAPASSASKAEHEAEAAPPVSDAANVPSASPEKWQGHWQAYEYGTKAWTVRFEGRSFYALLGSDDWYQGTIALRPDNDPAEIDFMIEDCRCSFAGQTSKGIFAWDGEAITLAAPRPGNPRPTVFNKNSGELVRLERIDD